MDSEREIIEFLEKERRLAKAAAIVLFDRSNFMRLESYDMSKAELDGMINVFCRVASELKELEGESSSPEGFFAGTAGKNLIYLSSITSDICLLGVFQKDTNFLKVYQSMGVLTEVLKNRSDELRDILKRKKEEFIKEREKESLPKTQLKYLAPHQVDAILEELKKEIGPAYSIIFKATVKEMAIDPKHITKEEAYELIHRLADRIGSFERKQKFLKVALSVVETGGFSS